MSVLKRDTDYHTYADYLVWSRTYGDELVDGTAWVREPPAPTDLHQDIVLELALQVGSGLENKPFRVRIAPSDVLLPKSTEEDGLVDTVVQPGVYIISNPRKLDARGVREVWLIHPDDHTLTIYKLAAGCYSRPTILELSGQTKLTTVPDVTIDWDRLLAKPSWTFARRVDPE
jgi:hypothetical protein